MVLTNKNTPMRASYINTVSHKSPIEKQVNFDKK